MIPRSAIEGALAALLAALPGAGQEPQAPHPTSLFTGRCVKDLPLDAGQGFDHQRFLVLKDRTYLFDPVPGAAGLRWRLASRTVETVPGSAQGPFRLRRKWRDGALWMRSGQRIYRRDPLAGRWLLKAEPALEFMDFEVDMTGRILLVATADPRTRTYRALLESVEEGGTTILAPYPDSGCPDWEGKISPVAAAALQAGYESVQILEFTVLFNPLARRLFVFRPLEDRIKEVDLGMAHRTCRDLAEPKAMDDLCWQILPKDATEAWLVLDRGAPGLAAIPLDLFEATAGEARPLPGLALPVFPDPAGKLAGLDEAIGTYERRTFTDAAGRTPPRPSPD